MKKFLKWFIGLIIVAAIAYGLYTYTDWFKCDASCETPATEEVITEPVTDTTEVVVPVDTLSVESVETITTIPVETNE